MSRLAWCKRSSGRGVVLGLDASLSDKIMTSGEGVRLSWSVSLHGQTRKTKVWSFKFLFETWFAHFFSHCKRLNFILVIQIQEFWNPVKGRSVTFPITIEWSSSGLSTDVAWQVSFSALGLANLVSLPQWYRCPSCSCLTSLLMNCGD